MIDYDLFDELVRISDKYEINEETKDINKDYLTEKERQLIKEFCKKVIDTLN